MLVIWGVFMFHRCVWSTHILCIFFANTQPWVISYVANPRLLRISVSTPRVHSHTCSLSWTGLTVFQTITSLIAFWLPDKSLIVSIPIFHTLLKPPQPPALTPLLFQDHFILSGWPFYWNMAPPFLQMAAPLTSLHRDLITMATTAGFASFPQKPQLAEMAESGNFCREMLGALGTRSWNLKTSSNLNNQKETDSKSTKEELRRSRNSCFLSCQPLEGNQRFCEKIEVVVSQNFRSNIKYYYALFHSLPWIHSKVANLKGRKLISDTVSQL